MQNAGTTEERLEAYIQYAENVPEVVTVFCAKSNGGVAGSASNQSVAVHGLFLLMKKADLPAD
jgi:hypothetical protein